jgi:hypothetical protein
LCVVGDMTRCFREVVASTMPGLRGGNAQHNRIEQNSDGDFVRKRVQAQRTTIHRCANFVRGLTVARNQKGPTIVGPLIFLSSASAYWLGYGTIWITPSRGPAGTITVLTAARSSMVTSNPKSSNVVLALISASFLPLILAI